MKTAWQGTTSPTIKCRVLIELESPDGDGLLQIDLARTVTAPSGDPATRSLSREIGDFLRDEVVAEVHDRVSEMAPANDFAGRDFESEFAHRCDATDRIVSSLKWLNPTGPSDAETRWMQGMTEIFMAQQQNDLMMRRGVSARKSR